MSWTLESTRRLYSQYELRCTRGRAPHILGPRASGLSTRAQRMIPVGGVNLRSERWDKPPRPMQTGSLSCGVVGSVAAR